MGWSPEEAAGLRERKKYQRHEKEFSHDGIDYQFKSLKQAAEFFWIDYKIAHSRHLKPNWTIKEVLELVPLPKEKNKSSGFVIEFRGKVFRFFAKFADTYQLTNHSVWYYLTSCGLSAEETYFVVSNDLQKELRKVKVKHKCTYLEAVKILKT